MPRPRSHIVITEAEHRLLLSVVGPFYGASVNALLTTAPAGSSGGRRIATSHPAITELLDAIGCEVHGYQKHDEEREGDAPPPPGGTANQLLALYDRIERHLA